MQVEVRFEDLLFQTTKLQIFESNSQQSPLKYLGIPSCFKPLSYKFLKAIHNGLAASAVDTLVVSNH